MTAAFTDTPLTAESLADAIRSRYQPPEWHVESEVTLDRRRLDLVAFNLWGARGYRVVGFECKVSRGDWMRELADFRKAEGWMRVVDDFYLVTPPKLLKPEELPLGWGHLELCGSRMMTRAFPAKGDPSGTLPREIIARFLTRMRLGLEQSARAEEWKVRETIREEERASAQRETTRLAERTAEAERKYQDLVRAFGLNTSHWGVHEKALRAAGLFVTYSETPKEMVGQLEHLLKSANEWSGSLGRALAQLHDMSETPAAEPTDGGTV